MTKGNMTKKEALDAMKAGHKVTREYFGVDEYIFIDMDAGCIRSEDGYCFDEWWTEVEPTIPTVSNTPWKIYQEDQID